MLHNYQINPLEISRENNFKTNIKILNSTKTEREIIKHFARKLAIYFHEMRTSFKGKFAQQEKVFKFNLCFIWLLANIKFSTTNNIIS
jgi:hypothetical protein